MAVQVFITSRQRRIPLSSATLDSDPTVVASEYLAIEVEGASVPARVRLNADELPLVLNDAGTRGVAWVNAFNAVGFHCLAVGDQEFYFGTEDAKLKLDGIRSVLDCLKHEGLAWRGPLFFADGTAIRHPKVDHAWLARMATKVVEIADAISDQPLRKLQELDVIQAPGSGRLDLTKTFALLRGSPRRLLESSPAGAIAIAGDRYFPRAVVAAHQRRSFDTVGNRRMTTVLLLVQELCRNLLRESGVPRPVQESLASIARQLNSRLDLFPFSVLELQPASLPDRPASEEIADGRYAASFELWEELQGELAWEAGIRVADRLAYVGNADQIYQAFVAVVLAEAFGAKQVSNALQSGLAVPVFRSQDCEIYYDTSPPRPEFTSWRDASSRPSDQRPDLTLIDRGRSRGLFVDAKYRVEPNGTLPSGALGEAQVYMQSFERRRIVICYPGRALGLNRVETADYTILEASLCPHADLRRFASEQLKPALEELMEPLRG
jgi:hypothetical protein